MKKIEKHDWDKKVIDGIIGNQQTHPSVRHVLPYFSEKIPMEWRKSTTNYRYVNSTFLIYGLKNSDL